jgi:hypothetical protein
MTKILDRLPPFPATRSVAFGERHVRIHRDELLVWVGVGLRGEDQPEQVCPPFPALLDTANNCEFYLHEHHLVHWAGFRPALLAVLGSKYINQTQTPCHEADVWIYPNQPGTTEVWKGKPPFRLRLPNGIAVAAHQPDKPITPRLPLLGLPALRKNDLDFWFDGEAAYCYLCTAGWRSKIMRVLHKL